jgi:biotin carboxylase
MNHRNYERKTLLMLGAGFMQGVAIRRAKERGWYVIAVDGNPEAACAPLADRFEPIDLKDREGLVSLARRLASTSGLDGVFTAATDFSASVAAVAEACGLPGHSLEAATNASDKLKMRECFARARVPSPRFIGVSDRDRSGAESALWAKGIGYPVVVKPVDNMGARGCRKVDSPASLDEAITDAIRYSRTGQAIVEEYMDGPEFSLEALVFDGEIHMTGCADRHIFFPPFFIEMGHTIPSSFPVSDLDSLVRVFKDGVKALGLSHGAAKGDVKLTSRGPMIGEIAGRLSGGYMSGWTFPYSSGIDLTGAALDLAVGERPGSLEPAIKNVCAERAWISIPGKVSSVHGLEDARAVPFVRDVFPRAAAGDTVFFPVNNVEKCGNCLASAADRESAVNAAETAARRVFLRLESPNARTDAFLEGFDPRSFPPSAFDLDPVHEPLDPVSAEIPSISTVPLSPSATNRYLPVPAALVPVLDTLRDWQGRTLRSAIASALDVERGLEAVLRGSGEKDLERYWNALLRGGIQAIVYLYDRDHR